MREEIAQPHLSDTHDYFISPPPQPVKGQAVTEQHVPLKSSRIWLWSVWYDARGGQEGNKKPSMTSFDNSPTLLLLLLSDVIYEAPESISVPRSRFPMQLGGRFSPSVSLPAHFHFEWLSYAFNFSIFFKIWAPTPGSGKRPWCLAVWWSFPATVRAPGDIHWMSIRPSSNWSRQHAAWKVLWHFTVTLSTHYGFRGCDVHNTKGMKYLTCKLSEQLHSNLK